MRFQNLINLATSPFVLGSTATVGLYAAIWRGHLTQPMLVRYLAGHPIEIITTWLFLIALAAQANKLLTALSQRAGLMRVKLGAVPDGGQEITACGTLLDRLAALPAACDGFLRDRLRNALEFVRRKQAATELESELKYLSDVDFDRRAGSHALVKVIIWAIPILGFLGTVIGLTDAIANLSPDALENSLPAVTAGLGVSFDTTALALALSMVLMFGQFAVDRIEIGLLERVDERVHHELAARFKVHSAGQDAVLSGVKRLADEMLRACVVLVEQQAELWQESLAAAETRWKSLADQQERVLGASLSESLRTYALTLAETQEKSAELNRAAWAPIQQSLEKTADAVLAQQGEMARQSELLKEIVTASCEVTRLEDVLNRNLSSLSKVADFEEMVRSLSAAVHLLTLKSSDARSISLPRQRTEGQAA